MPASPVHHTTRHAAIALAAAATLAGAAGCQARLRRTPDDAAVVVLAQRMLDVDPRFASAGDDPKLSDLVAPGLTSVDQMSLAPRMNLAESIERVDELVWEVTLRADARFSTGAAVTAGDVAFSYESTMNPALGSFTRKGHEERFARFEVIDDRHLRIHLKKPVATLLTDLEFGIVSRTAAGDDLRFEGGKVIGAGPYRVATFAQEKVVLERNPHWFGPPAPIARLVFRTVRDNSARTLMLIGGSADMTLNTLRVDLMGELGRQRRLELVTGPSAILTYLLVQTKDPLLDDVRVREAIACAIDRKRIIEAKFFGLAVEATGVLPPIHWAYDPRATRHSYDPDKARALLDAAGFPDPDGPGGRPRLSLVYKTSSDQFRVAVARLIAAQLGEVGIAVEVRPFEFHTFREDLKRGNFQIASLQSSAITDPDWLYAFFHSSRIPTPKEPNTLNRFHYRNARVDALVTEGRVVSDPEQRKRIYGEVQRIVADDLPMIPLWHEDNIAALHVDIDGYELLPNATYIGLTRATKRPR